MAPQDIGDMAMEAMGIFCNDLKILNVSYSCVTSQGIQLLLEGTPKLYDLNVQHCDHMTARGALVVITPDETKTFRNKFKRLNFANTNLRNGCCYWLSKSYRSLEDLDISNCDEVSDAGIIELTRGCKRLKRIICP